MSVASVSAPPPDLFTVLQQLNNQTQAQTPATTTTPLASISPTPSTDETSAADSTKKHHHGQHSVPGQIESAVTTALQNAPSGSDPNQIIQTAIQNALQQAANGQQNAADPNGSTSSQTAANDSSGDSTQSTSAFNTLLQSFGVDPKQFQQDFQSAVQNVNQGGAVDFASLFRNFPPGSSVNTLG